MTISTVASGVSDSVNLTGYTLVGFQMSTDWTDADIGFQVQAAGSTTFYDVYGQTNSFLTFKTSANRFVAINPTSVRGFAFLQLVSETSAGVAVAQAASRTIQLALHEIK